MHFPVRRVWVNESAVWISYSKRLMEYDWRIWEHELNALINYKITHFMNNMNDICTEAMTTLNEQTPAVHNKPRKRNNIKTQFRWMLLKEYTQCLGNETE